MLSPIGPQTFAEILKSRIENLEHCSGVVPLPNTEFKTAVGGNGSPKRDASGSRGERGLQRPEYLFAGLLHQQHERMGQRPGRFHRHGGTLHTQREVHCRGWLPYAEGGTTESASHTRIATVRERYLVSLGIVL